MSNNSGFSQVFIILGSALMLLGLLAVSTLVTKNQDIRNRANYSSCSQEKIDYCEKIGQQCVPNFSGGSCFPKPNAIAPTRIPTPLVGCGRTSKENGCTCIVGAQCQSTYCANSQCATKPITTNPEAVCVGGEIKCINSMAQQCYCRNNYCFFKSLGVDCSVTIAPTAVPQKIPTSSIECGLFGRPRGCGCINKSQCQSAICENGQCQ